MIFNTSWFLVFFPVVYVLFLLLPGARLRFAFLLLASAVFHWHYAGPAGVAPIVVIAVCTFGIGLALARLPPGSPRRKILLAAGVAIPVLALVYYKYRVLLLGTVGLGGPAQVRPGLGAAGVALPLAISFFTFEFVHYLTDVAKGSAPIRSPFRFAFFSIFFPSIVSGPIKRYQPFLAQAEPGIRRPHAGLALRGIAQVLVGFFKKLVIADNAALAIELLDARPAHDRGSVVLLMFLLSVRILFDFSGYSDIAIGLARMLGLQLPANFRYPYIARNISEFWQRWHISLSSWIRDYVYIPLGGGRGGPLRKTANLSVAMFLCGLWHGAAWHFGLWGLYHGIGLAVHSLWERSGAGRRLAGVGATRWAGVALTDAFVAFGWLLFFYPVERVAAYLRALWGT
ncbi:MAG TPA: MBOAT family O-acyltransferase [Thermoanaerobaculia bacterium]